MRVLVTGAHGFVGSHLVPVLERSGHAVVAWGSAQAAGGVDVRDARAVREGIAAACPDAIVHLAGITHLPKVLEDPETAFAVNVGGAQNVLEAVRSEAPRARTLVVSSGAVYGAPPPEAMPLEEDAPLLSEHPYGVQKISAECLAERYREDAGLDVVVVRPFNHLGPGQGARFAASWFAIQIAKVEAGLAKPPLRVGNLEPKRDVLDVRDVVRAYAMLLELPSPDRVYNVASGTSTRIGRILDWFVSQATVPVSIESDRSLFRPMDAPDLRGSHARLTRATGWKPEIPLEETLLTVLDDARAQARRGREEAAR